jgi:hypothetical protein
VENIPPKSSPQASVTKRQKVAMQSETDVITHAVPPIIINSSSQSKYHQYSQPFDLTETQATQENLVLEEIEENEEDYEEEIIYDAQGNVLEVRKVKRLIWAKLISFQTGEKPISKLIIIFSLKDEGFLRLNDL